MVTSIRIRLLLLCVLSLTLVALFAGCGGGGGGGGSTPPPTGDVTPPAVSASVILPAGWSFIAGDVTIKATVTDAGGVKSVSANVTPTIGTVTMPNTSGSTYQKVVTIAPNLTSTAVKYTVVVTGLDNAGNSGHSATLTFSVPASDVPPPPPGG